MPSPTRLCLPLVIVLLLGVGAAAAQQKPSTTLPSPSTTLLPRTGAPVRTIHLDVVVTRKGGEPVAGLQAKDFTLLDDKTPSEITSFEAVDADKHPVEAILLIDGVNTPYSEVSQARIEIDKFLRANGGKLTLPTTLAVLTDTGIQMQPTYTRDGNVLAASLAKYSIGLRVIGRSAGVQGAMERLDDSLKAIRLLAAYEAQRPGRKIILWVSPGWPLLSGPGVNLSGDQMHSIFDEVTWFSDELREGQTTVYSIDPLGVGESVAEAFYYAQFVAGVKKPSDVTLGNLGLQVMALQTGGLVLNSTGVSGLLSECVADNTAYYRISFEPPPTERRDVYHRLEVKVDQPGLTARTSTGYYNEP